MSDERKHKERNELRRTLIRLPYAYKGLVVWGTSGRGGSHILGGEKG